MSLPHPDAAGSHGAAAVAWCLERGWGLRWWQRLAFARLLEHDAEGQLVWMDALVSTARQVGKSVFLRQLALWRLHASEVFGEEQLILHTAKDRQVTREVTRPARLWARQQGYPVRESNGEEEIGHPDGSRWLLRGHGSVYSYSATLALADEVWKVAPGVVEDGLEPTLAEHANAQLVMFSTAHRRATALVPVRRAALLAGYSSPSSSLLLEWSAPRDADLADRIGWRQASPHWTPTRERLLEARLRRARAGASEDPDEDDPVEAFRAQYLNVWPVRRWVPSTSTPEVLVSREEWAQAADLYAAPSEGRPVAVAVEDWYGRGASAAAATVLPDGRILTWGAAFGSRADAFSWAGASMRGDGRREIGPVVVLGPSLSASEAAGYLGPEVVVQAPDRARRGLALLRSLVRSGRLVHSPDEDVAGQVCGTRWAAHADGGLAPAHRGVRCDAVKATAWAVAVVAAETEAPQPFYVF
jgi:hypothetical protein